MTGEIFIALIVTLASEIFAARLCGLKSKTELLVIVLINLVTNPLMNLFLISIARINSFSGYNSIEMLLWWLIAEVCVIFIEAFLISFALRLKFKKTIFLSIIINLSSIFAGIFLTLILALFPITINMF